MDIVIFDVEYVKAKLQLVDCIYKLCAKLSVDFSEAETCEADAPRHLCHLSNFTRFVDEFLMIYVRPSGNLT